MIRMIKGVRRLQLQPRANRNLITENYLPKRQQSTSVTKFAAPHFPSFPPPPPLATSRVTPRALELARTVWDYHRLNHTLEPADVIILLVRSHLPTPRAPPAASHNPAQGNHDLRVADRAVELYFQKLAPIVVFSGAPPATFATARALIRIFSASL